MNTFGFVFANFLKFIKFLLILTKNPLEFVTWYLEWFDFFPFVFYSLKFISLRTLLKGTSSFTLDINGKPAPFFATIFALVLLILFFWLFLECYFSKTTQPICMKFSGVIEHHHRYILENLCIYYIFSFVKSKIEIKLYLAVLGLFQTFKI